MNQNVKVAWIIGGVVIAILVILPLVFGLVTGGQGYGYRYGYGMMGSGMMGGFGAMGLMSIFWIVVLGAIIWAVVAAARVTGQSGSSDSSSRADSALEILKKRYARGEINKEEYEARKKDLT